MSDDVRPTACRVCARTFGEGRETEVLAEGARIHHGRGLCGTCYGRAQRRGTLSRWPQVTRRGGRPSGWTIVEDVAWLAYAGEASSTWRKRVDYEGTDESLARLLRRHGRADLGNQLHRETN
jgi:hypothetical protein